MLDILPLRNFGGRTDLVCLGEQHAFNLEQGVHAGNSSCTASGCAPSCTWCIRINISFHLFFNSGSILRVCLGFWGQKGERNHFLLGERSRSL